jgi:hypothetical protein
MQSAISNDNLPKSMRYGLMSSNAVQAEAMLGRYSSVNGTSFSPTGSNEIRIKVKANGFLESSKHYLSFTVTGATANSNVDTHAGSFFDRVTIEANGNVVEQIQSYGLYNSIRQTYNCPFDKIFKNAAEAGAGQLEFKNQAADAGADDGKIIKVRPGSLGEGITATHSKVFCIQLQSGLLLNHHEKSLPNGLVELDIVLRLAGNNQALMAATGQAPVYTISDPALYCPVYQILNGDVMASYNQVVASEGVMWSGDTCKTYINSMTNGAGTKNLQINDRSLSCKGLVTAFRDEGVDSVINKYANGAYGFQDGTGTITSYKYLIGSKNYPQSDVNISTATNGLNVGRVSEETLKALAKHGEKYSEGTVDRHQLVGDILDLYASATDAASTDVPKGLISVDLKKFSDDGLRMIGLNTAANSSPNTLEVTHTAMAGALSATTFAIVEAFFQMSPTGSLTSVM